MSTRIVISDTVLTGHPEDIRTAILAEYSGITAGEIEIKNDGFATDIAYADSVGAEAVVRSIVDLNSYIASALTYVPDIQTFFAFLSNAHSEQLLPSGIPNCVTVGAGVTANQTAYGNGLEFWDEDLDIVDPALSSFANGRVAGKLLKIKDTLTCSWWEARYRARMTASNAGVWDKYNGYGKIDVAAAIAYAGTVISNPYYPESPTKRQQIIDYVKTALSAIEAGATYYRTITTVDEHRAIPLEETELPAVIVRDLADDILAPEGMASTYNRNYHSLTLTLELVTNDETMAEVRQHLADIYKAIGTDHTLGGYAITCDPVGDKIQVDQQEMKIQGAIITIKVLYQTRVWQET